MRILLLTQVPPNPPDSGPKIKTHYVLRHLALRHQVEVVSFTRSPREEQDARALTQYGVHVTTVPLRRSSLRDIGNLARSLVTGRPFLIERDDSQAMRDAIESRLRVHRFDAVHADQLSMAQFAVDLPIPLRVLDEHNAVWTIVRRAAQRELRPVHRVLAELEWRKLRDYEGAICRRFDTLLVVSDKDRNALEDAAGSVLPTLRIPIAVDTDALSFEARRTDARDVLSVATMFYPPNVEGVHWFATRTFPLVRRAHPQTTFYIVGSRPPRKITALADTGSGIEVTGYIADLQTVLSRCAVLVVPVQSGSGMRVKILEAFARGIPVVSTTIGVEGIQAKHDEHLLIADSPQEFANSVTRILSNPGEGVRLAWKARLLVERQYNWKSALFELDRLYPAFPIQGLSPTATRTERSEASAQV